MLLTLFILAATPLVVVAWYVPAVMPPALPLPPVAQPPGLPPVPGLPPIPALPPALPPVLPWAPPLIPPVPPIPPGTPSPAGTPAPAAEAFLSLWTDGFITPITNGARTIGPSDAITRLTWSQHNAISCQAMGFNTNGLLAGTILAGDSALELNPGDSKTFRLRCQNAAGIWSPYREVTINKNAVPPPTPNASPYPPVIHGADASSIAPTTATIGQTVHLTFVAIDPDNDLIRYEIDWNNNGLVDESAPAFLVPSGSAVTRSSSWLAVGTHPLQVRAVDSEGNRSAWTPHSLTVVPASAAPLTPPQVSILSDRNLVRMGERTTLTLEIVASYEMECTYYGNAGTETFVHSGSTNKSTLTRMSAPLTHRQVFRVVCQPAPSTGFAEVSDEVSVGVIPRLEER